MWHQKGEGKVCVLGSVQMFADDWLDKEENSRLLEALFKWLRWGENEESMDNRRSFFFFPIFIHPFI